MDRQTILEQLNSHLPGSPGRFVVMSGHLYTSESALHEICARDPGARLIKWLSPRTALVEVPAGVAALAQAIRRDPPVYLQHYFPVQRFADLRQSDISGTLSTLSRELCEGYALPGSYSAQATVFTGDDEPTAPAVGEVLSGVLAGEGRTLDVRDPRHVLSAVVDDGIALLGLSAARDNLSKWACGIAHYAVSFNRAQLKLTESMEYFGLRLDGGDALDVGAAPGGWTQALQERGYRVWAVDPAPLDPLIAGLPGVTALRQSAQQFLRTNRRPFDIVVNDMILDCRDSARIMNECAGHLAPGGLGVMTAKLPHRGYGPRLKTALKILGGEYEIKGVRQLASNKSEVTVLLGK